MIFSIIFKFSIGGFVAFDESEVFVAGDGEADGADTGVEIENFGGFDVFLNFLKRELVDREVDLEEAVGGVGVFVAEEGVGEVFKGRVGLFVLEETAGDGAGLVTTKQKRLVFTSFFMARIKASNAF